MQKKKEEKRRRKKLIEQKEREDHKDRILSNRSPHRRLTPAQIRQLKLG